MQMRDICKTPGCQRTPNENLADLLWEGFECTNCVLVFLACLSGMSKTKPHGGFLSDVVKAKNAKVHLTTCDKPV